MKEMGRVIISNYKTWHASGALGDFVWNNQIKISIFTSQVTGPSQYKDALLLI